MSNNQLHGKKIEDILKSAFSGSSDSGRSKNATFDIESIYDKDLGLNTSIKCTKENKNNNETICLADARKFFSLNENFRLLTCIYKQENNIKEIHTIVEYIIFKEDLKKMYGDLDYKIVSDFHNNLLTFKHGQAKAARMYHVKRKNEIIDEVNNIGIIKLNPKISDNKYQRRLQCSVRRKDLESFLPNKQITYHTKFYKEIVLPLRMVSPSRKIKSKK